jgi:hypothetical protein
MNALYKGKHPNSIPVFVESKRKLIQAILHEPEDKPVLSFYIIKH